MDRMHIDSAPLAPRSSAAQGGQAAQPPARGTRRRVGRVGAALVGTLVALALAAPAALPTYAATGHALPRLTTSSPAACFTTTPTNPTVTAGQVLQMTLTWNLNCLPSPAENVIMPINWGDGGDGSEDWGLVCPATLCLEPDAAAVVSAFQTFVSHTYKRAGAYTVRVTLPGTAIQQAFTVQVSAPAPSYNSAACISITPTTQTLAHGQQAKLAITVTCVPPYDAAPIDVWVNWGDGNLDTYRLCGDTSSCDHFTPTGITALHTYSAAGTYTVSPYVVDRNYGYRLATPTMYVS